MNTPLKSGNDIMFKGIRVLKVRSRKTDLRCNQYLSQAEHHKQIDVCSIALKAYNTTFSHCLVDNIRLLYG